MKRNLFSLMAILLAMGAMATTANASTSQVGFGDLRADLNGDGEVTLIELMMYNHDIRGK